MRTRTIGLVAVCVAAMFVGRVSVAMAQPASPLTLVASWEHDGVNDVPEVVFANLGDYSEVLVVARGVYKSVPGMVSIQVSDDNGATFYETAGDYQNVNARGETADNFVIPLYSYATTAGRTGWVRISGFNAATPVKLMEVTVALGHGGVFTGSSVPLNAIRLKNYAGGLLTGGAIYVFARE